MSSSSFTITVVAGSAVAGDKERWLRLATDPPEKESGITKAQLAQALDSLIGITDHCSGAKSADAYQPGGAKTFREHLREKLGGQKCHDTAKALRTAERCRPDIRSGIPVKKNVYAHWSDELLAEDYKLAPLGSVTVLSGPKRSEKVINLVIDITDADYAPVRYHANEDALPALWRKIPPRWIGAVMVGRRIVTGPDISWDNDKIVLSKKVSGRMELRLPIIYDTWEIIVPGVWMGDGKRSYKAKVLGISDLLDKPAEVEIEDEVAGRPESEDCTACGGSPVAAPPGAGDVSVGDPVQVYCYGEIKWTLYKNCTGAVVDSGTDYIGVDCPDDGSLPTHNSGPGAIPGLPEYIRKVWEAEEERFTGSTESQITEMEYAARCCYSPAEKGCVPPCYSAKSTFFGKAWPGVEAALKEKYRDIAIEYIKPRSGVCGTRTDAFDAGDDCCRDAYVYITRCDNRIVIRNTKTEGILFDSEIISGDPPLSIKVDIFYGSYVIECLNYAFGDGSPSPWHFEFKYIINGETVIEYEENGESVDGIVHSQNIECGES